MSYTQSYEYFQSTRLLFARDTRETSQFNCSNGPKEKNTKPACKYSPKSNILS